MRKYTTADELAGSNVYSIAHDNRGYLWFATDGGISRFDGYKFTGFSFREGLEGTLITALANDHKGRLYAGTRGNGVYFLSGTFSKMIQERIAPENTQMAISGNFLYTVGEDLSLTAFDIEDPKQSIPIKGSFTHVNDIAGSSGDTVFLATDKGVYYSVNGAPARALIEGSSAPVVSIFVIKGGLLIGGNGTIFQYRAGQIETLVTLTESAGITHLIRDKRGLIWCTTANGKFYVYTGEEMKEISSGSALADVQVSTLFEDNEGNIWIGTLGKGAICLHHLYCKNYTKDTGLSETYITWLLPVKEGTLAGTKEGFIYIDNNGTAFPEKNKHLSKPAIFENKMFCNEGPAGGNLIAGKQYEIKNIGAVASFVHKNTLYYATAKGKIMQVGVDFQSLDEAVEIKLSGQQIATEILTLFVDSRETLWIGTSKGIFAKERSGKTISFTSGKIQTRITAFAEPAPGVLYAGTSRGLMVLRNNKWVSLLELGGRAVENITGLAADKTGRLWVSSMSGLYFSSDSTFYLFDAKNILLSDEIKSIAYNPFTHTLWTGTPYGLSGIDLTGFDKESVFAPVAIFKSLRVGDSMYRDPDYEHPITLPYTARNVLMRFSAIQFSSPGGIKFFYRFNDGPWEANIGRQIEFASLPYGRHVVQLKSVGERGVEGSVAQIILIVEPPFWATTWFRLLCVVALIAIIYFLVRRRFEVIRKKQQGMLELQSKMAELRHQALAASMNPHFIFNALNSIQHFINSHNTEEATEYLGKFARLIRIMLDSGGQTYISLEEEIHRIRYYLELEKIRFGDKLNYQVHIDPALETKTAEIPNMVIQPIVENALWHGLLPANRNGNLTVRFQKNGPAIHVHIEDDGIGINEGRRRARAGHQSLGIQMIRERLELLHRLSGYASNLEIRDRSELSPPGQGTIADITFG